MIRARPNDHRAIVDWLPLVRVRALSYWRSVSFYTELDDMVSIGMEAVWYAERTWNGERGASFSTHVQRVLEHALLKRVVHLLRPKRHSKAVTSLTTWDDEHGEYVERDTPCDWPDPEHAVLMAERARAVQAATDRLTARERRIVLQRSDEEPLVEIGRELGISRERTRQLQEEAFTKMGKRLRKLEVAP